MKDGIHPQLNNVIFRDASTGDEIIRVPPKKAVRLVMLTV